MRPCSARSRTLRLLGLLALTGTLVCGHVLLSGLPVLDSLPAGKVPPSTVIYDRCGRILYQIMDPQLGQHDPLPLEQIPLRLQQATIATEDASFYDNPGVDLRGILRALWINLRGGEVLAGGSTITQQLARNLLLSPQERSQRTLLRKLRESVLAFRLSRSLSKDHILELYLNQTDYGNLAYGVDAAAGAYFGKSAQDLDLAECALLAGLPQSPGAYNPLANPEEARKRQRVVLGLMSKHGYISPEEAEAAAEEELAFAAIPYPIRAPHFVMYVWEMLRHDFGEELIYKQGLRVYTTLDVDLQERIRDLARYHLSLLSEPHAGEPPHNVTDVAVMALDPSSGEILAMLGSPDYFSSAISGAVNMALVPRQPGSAIKPLTYAAAFSRGHTPATLMLDVPTVFRTREGTSYSPVNYDFTWRGPVLLREALASSLNVVAVKLLDQIGLEALLSTAHDLGITTLEDTQRFGLALTLGGGEVRLLELTAAYAALANAGKRVQPTAILRVESRTGEVIWQLQPRDGQGVLDERVAYLVTDILADDGARIPAFGEASVLALSRPAAAKTGTTTDWRDNWTVGYTPDLAVGVWTGNANNSPMVDVSGISGAAPIWHDVMEEALKGRPARAFERPAGVIDVEVCADSGMLPSALCPRRRTETFIAGSQPSTECTAHRMVGIDRRTGELATPSTPGNEIVERVAMCLPPEAAEWAKAQGTAGGALYMTVAELQGDRSTVRASITLTSPEPNAVYRIVTTMPLADQRIEVQAVPHGLTAPLQVDLFVDGQVLATLAVAPYSALWQLEPGTHAFRARALDANANTWYSDSIEVRVTR